MGPDYALTDELRAKLNDAGVFWMDIPRWDRRRTCFKTDQESDLYHYVDQEQGGLLAYHTTHYFASVQGVLEMLGVGPKDGKDS